MTIRVVVNGFCRAGRGLPAHSKSDANRIHVPSAGRKMPKLAKTAAEPTRNCFAMSVAGGGDTPVALIHMQVESDFTCVPSVLGAFLEWLEGKPLPGIAALTRTEIAA